MLIQRNLIVLSLVIIAGALVACVPNMKEFDDKLGFVGYMPSSMDRTQKYPMLFVLSNNGKAAQMASKFKAVADKEQVIVVADKNFNRDADINELYSKIDITLNEATRRYPVDSDKIFVVGFDEAATGAYILLEAYPKAIRGVIANCGIMTYGADQYRSISFPRDFPKDKYCVLITGPDDYRYAQMRADMKNLEALGWKCNWMEFDDSHALASPEYFSKAVSWLKRQVSSTKAKKTPAKEN